MALALVALLLAAAGRRDYPDLHTILDTGMGLLSGVLALVLWDLNARAGQAFTRWLAIAFAVTSALELIHVAMTIEWFGVLAPIADARHVLRPATWPPAALALPIGAAAALWALGRERQPAWMPAVSMIAVGAALFAAYQ